MHHVQGAHNNSTVRRLDRHRFPHRFIENVDENTGLRLTLRIQTPGVSRIRTYVQHAFTYVSYSCV